MFGPFDFSCSDISLVYLSGSIRHDRVSDQEMDAQAPPAARLDPAFLMNRRATTLNV